MEQLMIALPILILSVVLHEVAHGWVAERQGDPTARMLGRITLDPRPHIDPLGSVIVPGMLAVLNAPILGWARPVPVNPRNFRDYKRGDILVSLAGVAVNLALAVLFGLLLVPVAYLANTALGDTRVLEILVTMLRYGIRINLVLVLFNLLPIPPLDGSHVFYHLLPPGLGARYREMGRYGMLILFAILFIGGFGFLWGPVLWLENLILFLPRLLI